MNKKDLDALNELYLSVYDGEQLNELDLTGLIPRIPGVGMKPGEAERIYKQGQAQRAAQAAKERQTRASTQRRDMGVVLRDGKYKTIYTKTPEALSLADRLNKEEGRDKPKPTEKPTRTPVPGTQPAGSSPARPSGSSSTPSPRPAASSTVLAKQKGVEGKLDKATGKFTAGAFSDTEKSRYASVAAQNAARTSASSGASSSASAPKDQKISGGMKVYDAQKKAGDLKGAAETGMNVNKLKYGDNFAKPKTPNPLLKDGEIGRMKSASIMRQNNMSLPGAKNPTSSDISMSQQKAKADAIVKSGAVAALAPKPGAKPINNTKPPTPGTMTQSYEWPSAKTIRDIADAYSSIYEAKKVDQDQDGDNDFADVRIARMIASGVPKEVAIAKVKGKSYNEEVEIDEATAMAKRGYDETKLRQRAGGGEAADRATALEKKPTYGNKNKEAQRSRYARAQRGALTPKEKKQLNMEAYEAYEFVVSYLLENNFAETLNDANVIIENMSENWFESIMEDVRGASYTPNPIGNAIRAGAGLLKNTMNRPSVQGAIKTAGQMVRNNMPSSTTSSTTSSSAPSGGYSTRSGDGKPYADGPLWDGPETPAKKPQPQTKKPPMRDEPLF